MICDTCLYKNDYCDYYNGIKEIISIVENILTDCGEYENKLLEAAKNFNSCNEYKLCIDMHGKSVNSTVRISSEEYAKFLEYKETCKKLMKEQEVTK